MAKAAPNETREQLPGRVPAPAAGNPAARPAGNPATRPAVAQLAAAWANALGGDAHGILPGLAATLLSMVCDSPFQPQRAADAGRALAEADFADGEVLGQTLRVLSLHVPAVLGGNTHADLRFRLSELLGALASGYVRAIRDTTLAEQESIRQAEADAQRTLSAALLHQATHDPLTGLPNRAALFSRLGAALAAGGARVGLCYLDLDGFKAVNDRHGHDAGDRLLVTVAERIGRVASASGALAARIGGDEFVVLAEASPGIAGLIALANDILAEVGKPVRLETERLPITACAGIAESAARPAGAASIVADADAALYEAKSAGPGRWAVHDAAARRHATSFPASIRGGLERGEFRIEYEPVFGMADGRFLGAEAVPRWHHPAFGELPADAFVPLAEGSGAAAMLTRWMLEMACRDARCWHEAASRPRQDPGAAERDGVPAGGVAPYVSIRVPAGQLARPGLAAQVGEVLGGSGLAPGLLQLGFDETALADALGSEELRRLAALGVRVAVHSFGTGSAGFRYLDVFPVVSVGLHESLTAELSEPVIAAVTGLAHTLGLTVTATGLTDAAEVWQLARLGCDCAQGPYFTGPGRWSGRVPASRIAALIRTAGAVTAA